MAGPYTVQSQLKSVQVLSPSQVIDVEVLGATTIPSGVYFEVSVPLASWSAGAFDAFLSPVATAIEQRLSGGSADAASWRQDVDDTGLLTDYIDFVVSITPPAGTTGPMSTVVSVPMNLLTADISIGGNQVSALFTAAIDALNVAAAA